MDVRDANTSSGGQGVLKGLAEDAEGVSRVSPLTDGRWCNPKCWGLEAPPPTGPYEVAGSSRFCSSSKGSSSKGSTCGGRCAGPTSRLISSESMKLGPSQDSLWEQGTHACLHAFIQ